MTSFKQSPNGLEGWDYSIGKASDHEIYKRWMSMRQRCYREKDISYPNYGGRGLTVCEEWNNNFVIFYRWSMQNGWKPSFTIHRVDNNKGYSPENCIWISREENNKEMVDRHRKNGTGAFSKDSQAKSARKARETQGKAVLLKKEDMSYKFKTISDAAKFIVVRENLTTKWQRVKSNVSACCLEKRGSCHGYSCEFI